MFDFFGTLFAMHESKLFICFSWPAICNFDHTLFFIIQSYGDILKISNVLLLETYIGVKIITLYAHELELQKDLCI